MNVKNYLVELQQELLELIKQQQTFADECLLCPPDCRFIKIDEDGVGIAVIEQLPQIRTISYGLYAAGDFYRISFDNNLIQFMIWLSIELTLFGPLRFATQ